MKTELRKHSMMSAQVSDLIRDIYMDEVVPVLGNIVVHIPKKTPGEHFSNLGMLTTLLKPRGAQRCTGLMSCIEVISDSGISLVLPVHFRVHVILQLKLKMMK